MSDKRNAPDISGDIQTGSVDRVASSGLPLAEVAAELGLNETVLRHWVVCLSGEATGSTRRPVTQAPAPLPANLAAENARLRRENERLCAERGILKKAALIFGSASR